MADSSLSARFPIYTRANVGEVFPDPVTPLTFDSGLWLAELGWRDAWVRMGAFEADEFPADDYAQLGVVGGYCYLNASLIRLFGERAPGLSWQLIDEQFFGAQPGIPPYHEEPGDVRPDLTERIGATFGWALSVERLSDLTELVDDMRATKRLRDRAPGPVGHERRRAGRPVPRADRSAPQPLRAPPVRVVHGDGARSASSRASASRSGDRTCSWSSSPASARSTPRRRRWRCGSSVAWWPRRPSCRRPSTPASTG